MGVSATLLASGGIRARWSANGTYAYAEVNSDERISKGIQYETTKIHTRYGGCFTKN